MRTSAPDRLQAAVEIVVVWNNRKTLDDVFLRSEGLAGANVVLVDNTRDARGLPSIFNERKKTSTADWLIFCHQDFVVREKGWIDRVRALDPACCYGPIGVSDQGQFAGQIRQTDGTLLGRADDGAEVLGLDEMCLIVPRVLASRLDFDERLPFDLYVHDYCIAARKLGYPARTLQLDCQHKSSSITGAIDSPRYLAAKQYFVAKHASVRPLITSTFSITPKYWVPVDGSATLMHELRLIPDAARVLEIGPGAGHVTKALAKKGCDITALEVDAVQAEFVRPFCRRLIVGSVEGDECWDELAAESFDVILLGDVCEHLRDPGAVLRRLKTYLAPGGSIVLSIPNIAHGSVRLSLLEGRFEYRRTGLLDRTHISFFTADSVLQLCRENGYAVQDLARTRAGFFETEITVDPAQVPTAALRTLCRDSEATTYQFVFRAVPAGDAARATALPADNWNSATEQWLLGLHYRRWGYDAFWRAGDPARARQLYFRAFVLCPRIRPLLYMAISSWPAAARLVSRLRRNLSSGWRRTELEDVRVQVLDRVA
jgi:2-polyprenyl-3-methyl-5-hydroxy-6-metoxy-1,4-benzoquinol methylase